MNNKSKENVLIAVSDFMESHEINTQSIKTNNPLPVSPRWVDSLIHSVKNGTNQGFNKTKTKELLDFIVYPYKEDGSVLVVEKISDEALELYRAKKSKTNPNGRTSAKTKRKSVPKEG